ncbi:MAG: PP2C family protein-serine/threonine phosphatase [Ignavibacteriales bacterium]|nr:PP2C family protein-serine/threonine phosphatase [Ignavibacteriales bacterium]
MIEPKNFYRKLDFLLSRIGREKSGRDFLFKIVRDLENTFSNDLRIGNGRVYQEDEEEYVLIYSHSDKSIVKNIPQTSEALQNVLEFKTFIFNDQAQGFELTNKSMDEYTIPAAVAIHNPSYRWIIVFDLKSGWIREEIEFCLNAVRTALNSRLYSEAIKTEMEQAAYIQQSLLPSIVPKIPGYQVAGRSIPAELVGGDLYDFYEFDGDGFGLCVGDASGHGLPAALLVRDVITGLRMGMERGMKMVYTLKKLNRVIYKSVYSTRFISLFMAEFENNGSLVYANAGHPAPILVNGNDIIELESTGLIFGALPEINLSSAYAKMNLGSVLVLFSDGIFERQNKKKEFFGMERFKEIILKNKEKNAQEILDTLFSIVNDFGKKNKWEDDATILVIKRLKMKQNLLIKFKK